MNTINIGSVTAAHTETFEETVQRGTEAIGFEATLECFYFPAISSGSLDEFLAAGREKLAYKIADAPEDA